MSTCEQSKKEAWLELLVEPTKYFDLQLRWAIASVKERAVQIKKKLDTFHSRSEHCSGTIQSEILSEI